MEILKHVYFVRHGETDSNVDYILRGIDSMLTENGKEQAGAVARRIERIQVDALISSTYPRTLETARAIKALTRVPLEESDLFVEWGEASILKDKPKDDPTVKAIKAAIRAGEDADYRYADEETFAEMVARAKSVLELLEKHPAKRICVVTHGAFMRVIFGYVMFGERFTRRQFIDLFFNLYTSNTGITYAKLFSDRGWGIVSWNDSAHLG